jgi:hypothetical protein
LHAQWRLGVAALLSRCTLSGSSYPILPSSLHCAGLKGLPRAYLRYCVAIAHLRGPAISCERLDSSQGCGGFVCVGGSRLASQHRILASLLAILRELLAERGLQGTLPSPWALPLVCQLALPACSPSDSIRYAAISPAWHPGISGRAHARWPSPTQVTRPRTPVEKCCFYFNHW